MNDNTAPAGLLQRTLARACDIQPEETRATLASFLLVLMLMGSYYILRPVRDALASNWSDAEVASLWTITFFLSTIAVSLYGAAVARIRFQRLVPSVYGLFAVSFILFYLGERVVTEQVLLDKAFYLWVSLFSLFHISVFWSFMADTFSKPQATRLFGFIGAGASVGAILGPAIAALLVGDLGTDALLLIAAAIVFLTLPLVHWLQRLKISDLGNPQVIAGSVGAQAIGGNPLAGFSEFLQSSYLLGIGLFLFLFTSISSFVYFAQKNLLEVYDLETRTQILADMDLAVNSLTILVAAFATGRMANKPGHALHPGVDTGADRRGAAVACSGAAGERGRGAANYSTGGGLRRLASGARNTVHRRGQGNALQGQTGDRYRDLSRRRHAQRLGLYRTHAGTGSGPGRGGAGGSGHCGPLGSHRYLPGQAFQCDDIHPSRVTRRPVAHQVE